MLTILALLTPIALFIGALMVIEHKGWGENIHPVIAVPSIAIGYVVSIALGCMWAVSTMPNTVMVWGF